MIKLHYQPEQKKHICASSVKQCVNLPIIECKYIIRFRSMVKKVKDILVLSSENSCRSQMAEGYLKHFSDGRATIYSAGLNEKNLDPFAIQVMLEDGIDISGHTCNALEEYQHIDMDLILTVCNDAENSGLQFPSNALKFHYNFPQPNLQIDSEEDTLKKYRETRDLIKLYIPKFLKIHLTSNSKSFENFKL